MVSILVSWLVPILFLFSLGAFGIFVIGPRETSRRAATGQTLPLLLDVYKIVFKIVNNLTLRYTSLAVARGSEGPGEYTNRDPDDVIGWDVRKLREDDDER